MVDQLITTLIEADWAVFANVAVALGVPVALGGLISSYRQSRHAHRIAEGQFYLELYHVFQRFNDVHMKLTNPETYPNFPETEADLFQVDRNMGLLEVLQRLAETDVLEYRMVDHFYSHRIRALIGNKLVQARINADRSRWLDFLALLQRLRRERYFSSSKEAVLVKEGAVLHYKR